MDARERFFARMDASIEADRKKMDEPLDGADLEMDFGATESERTMILGKYAGGDDGTLDDMDFSITASSRTIGNTERSMLTIGTIGTIGTIDSEGSITTIPSNIMDNTTSNRSAGSKPEEKEKRTPRGEETSTNTSSRQQSFHPLVPLPEHPQNQRSAPRAIPGTHQVLPQQPSQQSPLLGVSPSLPSSAGSSGSAFLNNLLDPAASTFNNAYMSHTPPTHISTSYEASHFGKRARSGSISERLRVSTELEQKGMIDREEKGILKDLIISGQDNELQHALDRYEQGDETLLESMLQGGTLSNRATTDIDLLGDLDLDFLNVNDTEDMREEVALSHPYTSANNPMEPPPSLPTREQGQHMTVPASGSHAASEASDGIGELDFDGGIEGSDGFATIQTHERAPSPMYQTYGQRSRSNSTFSMDYDFRQRSNSLFSALIGNVPEEVVPTDYGRWMQRSPEPPYVPDGSRIGKPLRRASAPEIPSGFGDGPARKEDEGMITKAAKKRELRAEEKRRERQEKKEQKEKEKREKKEKRELAKLEKQKKAEMEEIEEHQPGSGRPRSMSDPNLRTCLDANGLLLVERPEGWIGAYSPESRKVRITRFLEKRNHRVWTKTVKYDVRKNFADSRLRVKGRFVKKEDELLMRELMSLT